MSLNEQSRKIDVAQAASETALQEELSTRLAKSTVHTRSYHELGDHHVVERDALEQLRYNLKQLEELHQRFGFMMREMQGLIK